MVEFALVLPLFLVLMLALVDASRMLFTYVSMTNATREMARTASFSGSSNTDAINIFRNTFIILGGVDGATDTVTVTVTNADGVSIGTVSCPMPLNAGTCILPARAATAGGWIQIDATHRFQFIPPFDAMLRLISGTGSSVQTAFTLTTSTRTFVE
jgi:Flp pilus assembly protein TadG